MFIRIFFLVKVVFGVVVVFEVCVEFFICWVVGEGYVVVGNVVEEVNLVFGKYEGCSNWVYRGIILVFVEEIVIFVEWFKVVNVGFGVELV